MKQPFNAYLTAVFSILLATSSLFGAETLGRFVGVLEHKALKKQQLAKLDFITSRENGNQLEMAAVLTLHFGDFKSQEYVAFHFEKVIYNVLTKTLVFDQSDQDATVIVDSFTSDKFQGRFRSVLGGQAGTLRLEKEGKPVKPSMPLIESVWGEYQGSCEGKKTTLQVYTARSTEDISKSSNPYATYRIRGARAYWGPNCFLSGEGYCIDGIYDSGEYNFYKNQLILFGRPKPITCIPNTEGLQCDGCTLKRVSKEITEPRQLAPVVHSEELLGEVATSPALNSPSNSVQGEYFGYVYHEYLNRYQPVSLNLVTFQEPSEGGLSLKMSAVATLYFGKPGGTESISYRFDTRDYPNPLQAPQFVFSRPEADIDAVLQISSIGKGEVKGMWYSQLFGRVGKFSLQKDHYPDLPSGTQVMEPIVGLYESSIWDMDLFIKPEGSGKTAANTENPFFPRSFDGGIIMKSGATPRIRITGGSYDFYTGRISLETDSGLSIGQRDSQRKMKLRRMTAAFLTVLLPFEPEPFRYLGEP